MKTEEVIFLGAGGGTRELLSLARHANSLPSCKVRWEVRGILDDNPDLKGSKVQGVSVLGTLADANRHERAKFILGIATSQKPMLRVEIARRMNLPDEKWATFIHPSAMVLDDATVGPGAIIYPGVSVSAMARIGAHSLAYYGAVIHHDSVVGAGCCLCAGVFLAGYVRIGDGCYLGMGAKVRDHVSVGEGALIGMGAAVIKDIPPGQIVAGVPARELRKAPK